MWFFLFFFILSALALTFLTFKFFKPQREPLWFPHEAEYLDMNLSDVRIPFNSIDSPPTVYLSVIVPAYNEKQRLPIMMDETIDYMKKREQKDPSFSWEIIVVDDGSKDTTTEIALNYSKREGVNKIRVLTLHKNRGKGGAVKRGMMCARGKYLLMADADAATKFDELDKVEKEIKNIEKNGFGIAVGSRKHLQKLAEKKEKMVPKCSNVGIPYFSGFLVCKGDC